MITNQGYSLTQRQIQVSWYYYCVEHSLIAKQGLGHIHSSLQSSQYHKPIAHQPDKNKNLVYENPI